MSDKTKTLQVHDMVSERQVGRRSALRAIGATFAGAAVAAAVTIPGRAEAQGASDSDSGPGSDPAGRGRTGMTDRDVGPNADGPGRGVCPRRGHTDSDAGPGADGAGRGRGPCHN